MEELGIVTLPQDQGLRHRLAQCADADLQRTAVRHQARGVQARRVIGKRHRFARRRKQRKVGRGTLKQHVEFAGADGRVAGHERQFGIHLANKQKIDATLVTQRQQIDRQVWITAQTVGSGGLFGAMRYQLANHVDAAVEHALQRLRIVGRDILLLRIRRVQPLAGLEEELVDFDVGRHFAGADRGGVIERRIPGEHTLRNRIEKAMLKLAFRVRWGQRERGEDGEPDRRIDRGLGVQRIDDVIGLAEAERQREHDRLADFLDDGVGDPRRIVEQRRRRPRVRMDHCLESQPGSGWKRGPYCPAKRLSVSRTSAKPRVRA